MSALQVALLGTGSPMPNPARCGAGQVIIGGGHHVLVDCGWGVARRIYAAGMLPWMVDVVCFTHMHSDHITDIADFIIMRWTGGAKRPLTVYGPEGTRETMDGFMAALRRDISYRFAHHGEKLSADGIQLQTVEVPATPEPSRVTELNGLDIEAFEVDHFPVVPALGFRFSCEGKSVVISGDTTMCPSLANASKGADLLVCEALNLNLMRGFIAQLRKNGRDDTAALLEDAMTYHSGTEDIAALARDAGIKRLVLSHIIPAIPNEGPLADQFTAGMSDIFAGEITLGRDLQRFEV